MSATESKTRPLRLAYAIAGAPTAWGIQFITVYALVDLGCGLNLDVGLIQILVLIATGVALLAALAAGWIAFSLWRVEAQDGTGQTKLIATVGMALSVLFALALVLTGLQVVIMETCGEIAA